MNWTSAVVGSCAQCQRLKLVFGSPASMGNFLDGKQPAPQPWGVFSKDESTLRPVRAEQSTEDAQCALGLCGF